MKNPTWRPEPRLDGENLSREPRTECYTITSSKLVLLYVCFLRLKKQRFPGAMGENKC